MIVAPLATDEELAACVAIDHASFDAPTFELAKERVRPIARLLVCRAEADGPVLGFLLAWLVVDEVHVFTVATLPAARRRGVGDALVDAVLRLAEAAGAVKLLLEARVGNAAAIALYAKKGFREINRRREYYSDGEDGIEMELVLPRG